MHRLAALLWQWLVDERRLAQAEVGAALAADYARCARHDWPEFLRSYVQGERKAGVQAAVGAQRQARHRG